MADLIAIVYDDEATAAAAAEGMDRLMRDLVVEPEDVAVIVRDPEGMYTVTTSHHPVDGDASYGMFWALLFRALFFGPVLGGDEQTGIDRAFQDQVRDMVQPGMSALFLVLEQVAPDKAIEALSKYGGTVLKSSLPKEAGHELQDALRGAPAS